MFNEYTKNQRIYPVACAIKPGNKTAPAENKSAIQKIRDTIAEADVKRVPLWPDGGMNSPSSSFIYPREDDQSTNSTKKIHSFGLNEDIDDSDDQNDLGGIDKILGELKHEIINHDSVDVDAGKKYGPGNYPDDETEFTWFIPGALAVGPLPTTQKDFNALKKAGFKSIVSVFDKELDLKQIESFRYLFVATPKGAACDLSLICKFIDLQEELNNPVFVHSLDGNGRAATIAAAYFVHKGYLTAQEAIEYVRKHYEDFDGSYAIEIAQQYAIYKFVTTP